MLQKSKPWGCHMQRMGHLGNCSASWLNTCSPSSPPLPMDRGLLVDKGLFFKTVYEGQMGSNENWPSWVLDTTVAKNIQKAKEKKVCVGKEERVVHMMLSLEPAFQYWLTITVLSAGITLHLVLYWFQLGRIAGKVSFIYFQKPTCTIASRKEEEVALRWLSVDFISFIWLHFVAIPLIAALV